MGELDRDIAQLESLLRRLEKEYDQFLSGQLRREPAETENAVLAIVRGWSARGMPNPTLAFKFNTLVARYNSFRTVWQRRLREKEEGRTAKPARAAAPRAAAPVPVPPAPRREYLAADPAREEAEMRELFAVYRRLREDGGETPGRLTEEAFRRALGEKIETIKRTQGCEAVLVRIVEEEGRTRIVARPVRRRGGGAGAEGGA